MLGIFVSLHLATSAVVFADQPTRIINEYNSHGPRDITVLLKSWPSADSSILPKCTVTFNGSTNAVAFAGTKPLRLVGQCTIDDIRRFEERLAEFARFHMGDKGRH